MGAPAAAAVVQAPAAGGSPAAAAAAAAPAGAPPPVKLTLKAPKLLIKGPWGQAGPAAPAAAGPPGVKKIKKKKKKGLLAGAVGVSGAAQQAGAATMPTLTSVGQVMGGVDAGLRKRRKKKRLREAEAARAPLMAGLLTPSASEQGAASAGGRPGAAAPSPSIASPLSVRAPPLLQVRRRCPALRPLPRVRAFAD